MARFVDIEVVRQAGLLERFHITRHFLGLDSCVLAAAEYKIPIHLNLNKATIIQALHEVVKSHLALGVRLVGETTSQPSFGRLPGVDLSRVVEVLDSDNLQAAFEAQLSRPFITSSDMPLWRVVIMRNHYVIFAWHHAIGDGLSGLAFHRALLASLKKVPVISSDVKTYVPIPPTTLLFPAIETLTSLSPSWWKILQEIYDLFAPTSWTRGASAWTGNSVTVNVALKTRVRFIELTPEDVQALLTQCRLHGATLTSTYHVLATSVLSALISGTKSETISSYVPVSLRNIAGTSPDTFCDHVSTVHTYPPIQSTFSWVDATTFSSLLRSSTLKTRQEIGMLKFLFGQYEAYFKGKIGQKRQGGLELSNLGRFDIQKPGIGDESWSTMRMAFAQCDSIVGSALKLNCVGDSLGGITIAVTWGENCIPDSLGESFVFQFEEGLQKLMTM
ncbi:alcohol acetyltransferase [Collybia nuda]|uniref:Alcohol acetyltransferase n=1 Tax=Collybia nuda TaxID=64659 RepID=A0A9P5Y469_9AGAR|nr:alcohol acetyltransferase [Collybia nuda]